MTIAAYKPRLSLKRLRQKSANPLTPTIEKVQANMRSGYNWFKGIAMPITLFWLEKLPRTVALPVGSLML